MPGTNEEYLRYASTDPTPENWDWDTERWADGTAITLAELRDIERLRDYVRWYRLTGKWRGTNPQRVAMRLLRSMLTREQKRQLRTSKAFMVHTPGGRAYRIDPRRGLTEEVTRHGKHWFVARRFCLHDSHAVEADIMPPADLALAHMLLLLADEAEFLRLANATDARDQLWNRGYLARIRQARRERLVVELEESA